jgi:hypothetical protein
MKMVPLPRSSYVRVKPFGTPPDSDFDFSALNSQTPTNGSIRAAAGAGGGVARAVVLGGVFAGVFAGGFGGLCANATVAHASVEIAASLTNVRRACIRQVSHTRYG